MAAMRRAFSRIRAQRGAELIELAMVTPILLLMMAAIFDFGMLFRSWETVTNAAREGARVGVLNGYATGDVVTRVQQYMQASGVISTSQSCTSNSYNGSGICPSGICSVCVQTLPISTTAGTFKAVYVTVASDQTMPSLGAFAALVKGSFGTVPLRATTMMRAETTAGPAGP